MANIVLRESLGLGAPEKAQQDMEGLNRLRQLRRAQAQIALESARLDAELNAPHHLPGER